MYDVAIVMINFNTSQHTIKCIESIIEKTSCDINYQIIIVDNCSEKEDYFALRKFCEKLQCKSLKLIRSNINTGFSGGNMFGVQFAEARYLAFINNDVILVNDCFSILKTVLEQDNNIGVAGGQPYNIKGDYLPPFDHYTSVKKHIFGRKLLNIINTKKYIDRNKRYDTPLKVNYIVGSLMFFRAVDFYEIGGFDTNLFFYYEEGDICKRLFNIGKLSYFVPSAEFIHDHGASTKKTMDIKKEVKISLLYVIRKHSGYLPFLFFLFFLQLRYFFTSIFRPRYWSLFYLLLTGASLSKSLKQKQKIVPL